MPKPEYVKLHHLRVERSHGLWIVNMDEFPEASAQYKEHGVIGEFEDLSHVVEFMLRISGRETRA